MNRSQWWQSHLQSSLDDLVWAVEQIPEAHLFTSRRPDRWPVARIVFHLVCYEQRIALPWMRLWFGAVAPPRTEQEDDARQEELDWNSGHGHALAAMLNNLRVVRAEQIQMIANVPDEVWLRELPALWGTVPLHWVVTKTFQHTLEHTDEILRSYLWWR